MRLHLLEVVPEDQALVTRIGPSAQERADAGRSLLFLAQARNRPWHNRRAHGWVVKAASDQGRASSTRLNGVSVARVTLENPPSLTTSANLASPACAPSARPTSWSRDAGVQITVEAP